MSQGNRLLLVAGVCLGAGLGGFLDGIVLHQILQWHNMLSSIRPPLDIVSMKVNMAWDGVFHAFAWLTTVVGVIQLFRAGARGEQLSRRILVGGSLLGFGSFNVAEGVLDHHVLGIHHVHPGRHELAWDVAFLLSGGIMALTGWWLVRRAPGASLPA